MECSFISKKIQEDSNIFKVGKTKHYRMMSMLNYHNLVYISIRKWFFYGKMPKIGKKSETKNHIIHDKLGL